MTLTEALTANEFHTGKCTRRVGPRGGVTFQQEIWRRNGKTKTWKREPERFSIPVKYGLYHYGYINNDTNVHTRESCPFWHNGGTL